MYKLQHVNVAEFARLHTIEYAEGITYSYLKGNPDPIGLIPRDHVYQEERFRNPLQIKSYNPNIRMA